MSEKGGAMAGIRGKEPLEGQVQAYGLAFGHLAGLSAMAACELGIPDMLASSQTGLTSLEMARQLGHDDAARYAQDLDRLLRLLCAHGVFAIAAADSSSPPSPAAECSGPRYKLTAISRWLCLQQPTNSDDQDQSSVFPLLRFFTSMPCLAACHHLAARVLQGAQPFQRAHGDMDVWSFARAHPGFAQSFNDAMACSTRISVKALLNCYGGFETTRTLVDVGGGDGTAVRLIVQQYPHIQGIILELPHTAAAAPPPLQGVQHIGGDMFESIPSCDTILLKWILHDWGDEDCIKILQNCHKALSPQGKLIILDALMSHDVSPTMSNTTNMMRIVSDMILMLLTAGGKERTRSEFEVILHASGFKITSTIDLPCPECVIEASPIAIKS